MERADALAQKATAFTQGSLSVSHRGLPWPRSPRSNTEIRGTAVPQDKQPAEAPVPEDARAQAGFIWGIHSHFPTPSFLIFIQLLISFVATFGRQNLTQLFPFVCFPLISELFTVEFFVSCTSFGPPCLHPG